MYAHTHEQFLNLLVGLGLDFFMCLFRFGILCFFCVSLDQFIAVSLAFVVSGLVYSALSCEIGWEERLQNDRFCVEWDVKRYLSHSVNWGGGGRSGTMGGRSPGCFFWVLPKRSIPKPDQCTKDIIQQDSLGTDVIGTEEQQLHKISLWTDK